MVVADSSWDMLVVRRDGQVRLSVWGAMTQARPIPHQEGEEYLGIRFKLGTFIPPFPSQELLNTGIMLPEACRQSFWLGSSTWQLPDYENADTFIEWLARDDLVAHDPVVNAVLQGQTRDISLRSAQRHFQRTTGLTQSDVRQIERARQAQILLMQGLPILDTVHQLGYADQAHLTRSLKRFVGQTPTQIIIINPE
jgi:AraC-like DNA-binding protein